MVSESFGVAAFVLYCLVVAAVILGGAKPG
jgi:hypothetical protein